MIKCLFYGHVKTFGTFYAYNLVTLNHIKISIYLKINTILHEENKYNSKYLKCYKTSQNPKFPYELS
mgnify:CR=1 FL=1